MTKMNLLPAFDMEYSSDEEDIYQQKSDEIYRIDKNHMESDKENGKYYIGIYNNQTPDNLLILSTSVSPQTFFQYPFNDILTYLHLYSISLLIITTFNFSLLTSSQCIIIILIVMGLIILHLAN